LRLVEYINRGKGNYSVIDRQEAIKAQTSQRRSKEMIIYGTALLAVCHLTGLFLGDLLGEAIGVKSNVGGVGIAMLMLICLKIYLHKHGLMPKETEAGVGFWGAMYIPVVVAMAASQNVVAALKGGPVALLSAFGAAVVCACVIAVLSRTAKDDTAFGPEHRMEFTEEQDV
jgi:malonate transporter MadL subunit